MTNERVKAAVDSVFKELARHTDDPGDMLVILGTTISTIARATTDPVASANMMIEGIQNWVRLYRAERSAS